MAAGRAASNRSAAAHPSLKGYQKLVPRKNGKQTTTQLDDILRALSDQPEQPSDLQKTALYPYPHETPLASKIGSGPFLAAATASGSGVSVRAPTIRCPDQHTLIHREGTYPVCEQQVDLPPSYICGQGFILSLEPFQDENLVSVAPSSTLMGRPGTMREPRCVKLSPAPRYCPAGYQLKPPTDSRDMPTLCEKTVIQNPSPICPPGFQLMAARTYNAEQPTTCQRLLYLDYVPICPKGRLVEGQCEWEVFTEVERVLSCADDEILMDTECVKRIITQYPETKSSVGATDDVSNEQSIHRVRRAHENKGSQIAEHDQSDIVYANTLPVTSWITGVRVSSGSLNAGGTNKKTNYSAKPTSHQKLASTSYSQTPPKRIWQATKQSEGHSSGHVNVDDSHPVKGMTVSTDEDNHRRRLYQTESASNTVFSLFKFPNLPSRPIPLISKASKRSTAASTDYTHTTTVPPDTALPPQDAVPSTFEEFADTQETLGLALQHIIQTSQKSDKETLQVAASNDAKPAWTTQSSEGGSSTATRSVSDEAQDGLFYSKTSNNNVIPILTRHPAAFVDHCPVGYSLKQVLEGHRCAKVVHELPRLVCPHIEPSPQPRELFLTARTTHDRREAPAAWLQASLGPRRMKASSAIPAVPSRALQEKGLPTEPVAACSLVETVQPWRICSDGFQLNATPEGAACALTLRRPNLIGQCPHGTVQQGGHCVRFSHAEASCEHYENDTTPYNEEALLTGAPANETRGQLQRSVSVRLVRTADGTTTCRQTHQIPPTVEVVASCVGYTCFDSMM